MRRRFVRSIAVVGTIGLSSLGADAAAAALTTPPPVHAVGTVRQAPDLDAGTVLEVSTEAAATTADASRTRADEPQLVDLTTAAAVLGRDLASLRSALRTDGATLRDLAAAHGVPSSALEAALVDEASRRLDAAALAGRISPWDVWERRAVLPDVVAAAVQADRSLSV